MSTTDAIIIATNDLLTALENPHPAFPSLQLTKENYKALKDTKKMFNKANKPDKMKLTALEQPMLRSTTINEKNVFPKETQNQQLIIIPFYEDKFMQKPEE